MYQCFLVKFPFFSGNVKLYSPYLMDHENNPDTPLLADGKIVFFKTKNGAINFMRNNFCNLSYNDEPTYEFDPETFIENIRTRYHRGVVIDVLNIVFDYLKAIKAEEYPFFSRNEIFDFADYATFHREIGEYFHAHPRFAALNLIDFLHWFLGKISCHAILASPRTLPEIIRGPIQPPEIQKAMRTRGIQHPDDSLRAAICPADGSKRK